MCTGMHGDRIGLVKLVGLWLGLTALFFVTGCPYGMPGGQALVRVAHLSPDAPAVDVLVDGDAVLENVSFAVVSSYLELPAGIHRIQVTPAGQPGTVVIDATVDLDAGVAYTVAARGLLGNGSLAPSVFVDDRVPQSGKVKVRFIHTSPDAPAVDVAVAGGAVLFGNVSFPNAADYLTIDPVTVDLEVRLAGTDTVALPVPGVDLAGGTNYTIFAVGLAGDGSLAALPVVDTP